MKTIIEYFKDSYPSANLPMHIIEEGTGDYKIYFPNMASYLIYEFELSGQISDGKWENSRPYDHWKWVCHTEPKIDKNKIGYEGPIHRMKYSTKWLHDYVKKAMAGNSGDYQWTIRVFKYAKFGSVLANNQLKNIKDNVRIIIESLPDEPVDSTAFDAMFNTEGSKWKKKYWEQVKDLFTDDILNKYYNSNYDWAQFEEDLEAATKAINTPAIEPEI